MKTFLKKYPFAASLVVAALFLGLNLATSLLHLLPNEDLASILGEVWGIAYPLALAALCGRMRMYREGSFLDTIAAGLFVLGLQMYALWAIAMLTAANPDTQWAGIGQILLGLVMLFGVGFREETVFRGIIAGALWEKYGGSRAGIWRAALLSGLIFGLIHMGNLLSGANLVSVLVQTAAAAAIGTAFAAIYFRGGNLWALVLLHSLTDTASLFGALFTKNNTLVDSINTLGLINLTPVVTMLLLTAFLLRPKKIAEIIERHEKASL